MKIGHHHSESLAQPAAPATAAVGGAAGLPATGRGPAGALSDPAQAGGSLVSLSAATQSLVSSAAGSDGGFDSGKVKTVRDAIANGSYQVNHEAIADKLLANAQDMLSRTSAKSGS